MRRLATSGKLADDERRAAYEMAAAFRSQRNLVQVRDPDRLGGPPD